MSKKIAIIGGGNLGTSIAEGLISSKFSKAADITITRRNINLLEGLRKKGVVVTSNNSEAVKKSEVVILAVKPFQVKEVVEGIRKELSPGKHIVVSVITGVFIDDINGIIKKTNPFRDIIIFKIF